MWDSWLLAVLVTAQRQIDNTQPAAQMVLAGIPGLLVQRLRDSAGGRVRLAETTDDAIRQVARPDDSAGADDDTPQSE